MNVQSDVKYFLIDNCGALKKPLVFWDLIDFEIAAWSGKEYFHRKCQHGISRVLIYIHKY